VRIDAKFKADIEPAVKLRFYEETKLRMLTVTIAFPMDREQFVKRFGQEITDIIYAAFIRSPQLKIEVEGEPAEEGEWRVGKFEPQYNFSMHTVRLGGAGPFGVQPEFKGVYPQKGGSKVSVKIDLPLMIENATQLGALGMLAGEVVDVEFVSDKQAQVPGTAPPAIRKQPGRHGNLEPVRAQ
jgi:hypothetical protein